MGGDGTPRDLTATLDALRAIAESSRLRIVALLRHRELTVTDLTEILGQSQPRVSRHLKLLVDAGVVAKHREGTRAFFRLVDDLVVRRLVDASIDPVVGVDDTIAADLARLDDVRRRRADAAREYFERIAPIWDEERSLHADAGTVEAAVIDAIGDAPLRHLLDLGTGTGRMLQLLADRAERAVGLDASHSMLSVARANLERADAERAASDGGRRNWELRQGDVYSPPLDRSSFDLVVVHQVLHYLDDPDRAIAEAARLVAPGGRLVVVDLAPHRHDFLRGAAHRRLGFAHDQLREWFDQAGIDCSTIVDVAPPAAEDGLTVTIWVGHDRRPAPTAHAARANPDDEPARSERNVA